MSIYHQTLWLTIKCFSVNCNITSGLNCKADLCRKMESLEKNFNAIRNLKALQRKEDSSDDRIFSTWTIEEFCDASKRLLDLYTKELSLKQRLVMEFTHCKNRDELMVYLSLWLHEPLLDDDNEVLLESMLIEAGLR